MRSRAFLLTASCFTFGMLTTEGQYTLASASSTTPTMLEEKSLGAIKGLVVDKGTQQPLAGVNIIVENTRMGTTTDPYGVFTIPKIADGKYTLVFDYIGYGRKLVADVVVITGETVEVQMVELQEQAISLREVVVTPGSYSIMGNESLSRQTLSSEDIQIMSWAEDITRAVVRLPGISSNDFSSKFTIRGGEADEVLVALDGMELYEPFHQKDFAGGIFSTVDIEAIEGIDLMTGGFSAEYGDRMSGVFNMRSKNVTERQRRTSVGLSLMNARVYSQGSFNHNKGGWLVSARRGYIDLVLDLVNYNEISPSYYDVLGKVDLSLNDIHRLSFHILHSGDNTKLRDIKPDNFDRNDTHYGNSYGWFTLKSFYTKNLFSQTAVYSGLVTHDRTGSFGKDDLVDHGTLALTDKRDYYLFGFKQDWNVQVSDRIFLKSGYDLKRLNADYKYHNAITDERVDSNDNLFTYEAMTDVETNPSGTQAGVYLSSRFQILSPLTVEAGLRYDYASYAGDELLSPRVSFAYAFSKNTALRGGWGYYYQSQNINTLNVQYGESTFYPAQLAKHYVLGIEHLFGSGLYFRAEGYYKDLSRVQPTYQNLRDPWEIFPESRNDVVKVLYDGAATKGIEFFVKYDTGKKFSLWWSYALAYAEDDIRDIEYDGLFIERTGKLPRLNDQRHTAYFDLNYRPNKKWHFNLSSQVHTGWPYTRYQYDFKTRDDGSRKYYQVHEEFNGARYPLYHRVDLRVNRHFYTGNGRWTTFLHIINLYNHQNLKKYDLDIGQSPEGNYSIYRDDTYWFGLLPSFGVSWEF